MAAGFAGGASSEDLEQIARSMRFRDVAGCCPGKLGFVATDLHSGEPAIFRGPGEIFTALRASCSYPGLFHPVRHEGRLLVDGAVGMEIPALPVRDLGAQHVIAVTLPPPALPPMPGSVFNVVGRCFQILQRRTEASWRSASDLVISPTVTVAWDDFSQVGQSIAAGERAAEAALPAIEKWLVRSPSRAATMTLGLQPQG